MTSNSVKRLRYQNRPFQVLFIYLFIYLFVYCTPLQDCNQSDATKKNSFSRSQESITTKRIWRQHKSSRHILAFVLINFVKAMFIFRCIYYYSPKNNV